jgi:hypothetical protein
VTGNLGTYTLELENVNTLEARVGVTLKNRHAQEEE